MAAESQPSFKAKWGRRALYAFLAWLAIVCVLMLVVFPIIGLVTGELYMFGRGGHSGWVEGPWARVLSAVLLLIGAWAGYSIWKSMYKKPLAEALPVWQRK